MTTLKEIADRNKSFQANKEGLHLDIIGFSEELMQEFPNAVFTSGKRAGAVTNFGKPSRHAKGEAVDLRITPEIGEFLSNDPRGIALLHKYQLGFLDESKPENQKYGNAFHIGKDSALVERTNSRWAEVQKNLNKGQEQPNTITLKPSSENVSGVTIDLSNAPEEEKSKEEQEVETAEKNIALEERKLKAFEQFNKRIQPQEQQEVSQQETQQPEFNVLETYQNIDQFVSNPIMQRGGQIPTSSLGQYQYPNQVVNVPTNGSITMQGVGYPLLGISQETGERKTMLPNQEYFFKNTSNVLEIPLDFLQK